MKKIWNNNGKKILVPKEQREPILQRVKLIGRKRSFRIGTYTVSVTEMCIRDRCVTIYAVLKSYYLRERFCN